MIPTEFRLEHVAAGLVERLDGARRSFDDEDALRAGFRRITAEHLDSVLRADSDLRFVPGHEQHEAFLRREVVDTLLPRVCRDAHAMNVAERAGFGFGPLAAPMGRLVLVLAGMFGVYLMMRGLARVPGGVWISLLALGIPFLPDLSARFAVRRYSQSLAQTLEDLGRIQDQVAEHLPDGLLLDASPVAAKPAAPVGVDPTTRPPTGLSDG